MISCTLRNGWCKYVKTDLTTKIRISGSKVKARYPKFYLHSDNSPAVKSDATKRVR